MRRIGLDFDNTIICYDDVFLSAAKERGLLSPDFSGAKQHVREAIRALPDGEIAWQRLQGFVYGRGIVGARAFDGFGSFMKRANASGDALIIVSHKTEYGHFDQEKVNLRHAALDWMRGQRFFDADGFNIPMENVYFESTRAEKLRRIAATRCELFIDDLEEVLSDPDFPKTVDRILFSDRLPAVHSAPYKVCADWPAVEQAIFA
jgi:hypothetical protein